MTRTEKLLKRNELKSLTIKLCNRKDQLDIMRTEAIKEWMKAKHEYERLEYELALEDERFEKAKPVKVEKIIEPKLSIADILSLAEILGVEVGLRA